MIIAAAKQGRFGAAFEWLGVERAWTRTRGAPDVVIGIVDEGVQLDHPLLGPNIQKDLTHLPAAAGAREIPGTHAAGVAAGRESEAEHFSGVAPAARLLPVRFTTGTGHQALDLAQAIEYAAEMGACIINVSHAGDIDAPATQRAIQYAAARNVLVVCSASETSRAEPRGEIDDPVPNQINVLSVGENFEPLVNCPRRAAHLGAPGFARVPHWRDSGHSVLIGSAMGAPYVSGCAALVKALNPGWGYHELKEHLLVSGTACAQLEGRCLTGSVLSIANAVLGPIELVTETSSLTWSSLGDAEIAWRLRYRSALCANAVALYRPHGDEHWRELGFARAGALRMTIPASALRRSSGMLRIACRESNFHTDEIALTIR
ncbi:MAG TPA: S8 family serine peptidase [Steroidobacteraceae bacterium]|jgi:subtilisin family serine protease|nr:S8 family serine peptidase [Steroidobacteraceae bacterium]